MKWPTKVGCTWYQCPHHTYFCHMCKSFIIINSICLDVPLCNQSCFVLSTFPLGVCFIVNTHLQPTTFFPFGRSFHVLLFWRASSSFFIASFHFGFCLAHIQSFGIGTVCNDATKVLYAGETIEYKTYILSNVTFIAIMNMRFFSIDSMISTLCKG